MRVVLGARVNLAGGISAGRSKRAFEIKECHSSERRIEEEVDAELSEAERRDARREAPEVAGRPPLGGKVSASEGCTCRGRAQVSGGENKAMQEMEAIDTKFVSFYVKHSQEPYEERVMRDV
ncbi:unnamed protein product [Pleuronectes platessa]|uniref:Uncharacterized protein n=1 Tax=Pleuronectes platessa TaxID=8262 RepID=A0A9N7W1P7_PLEPL|nr:unnamed protein product [Pleuronectes platessa]